MRCIIASRRHRGGGLRTSDGGLVDLFRFTRWMDAYSRETGVCQVAYASAIRLHWWTSGRATCCTNELIFIAKSERAVAKDTATIYSRCTDVLRIFAECRPTSRETVAWLVRQRC